MARLTFFTRDGCPLCTEARDVVDRLRRHLAFEYEEVDITQHPEWFQEYKWDIPVVHIDGEFAFKHRLEEAELRAAIEAAGREPR
jgi:glutaredoxin